MLNTTVGQLLINETLPESLRDYNRTLDKPGTHKLLEQVAREHPEKYRDISFKLSQLGQRAAQDQGGLSFGLRHLKRSRAANEVRDRINSRLSEVLADDSLTDKQRSEYVIRTVGRESEAQQKAVYAEAVKDRNPIGLQILSGSRGNAMNLASLLASDMLYTDHRDEVIPIPVLRSYAEGLSPAEYWAGTYGARRGIISTKFATQEAGHLSKQLNQAAHRLVVTGEDEEADPTALTRGLIVDTDDMDNEGALLAKDTGPYPRNTLLTPKILKQLSQSGNQRILVRSPLVGGSADGGVYARDVGVRETGKLPGRGEQVGLQAAQALCLAEGTLVRKADGSSVAIEQLKPGDMVLGCDRKGNVRPVAVLNLYDNGPRECWNTVFRRGTGQSREENLLSLKSTLDHKLLSVLVKDHAITRRPEAEVRPVGVTRAIRDRFYAKLPSGFDDTSMVSEPFAMIGGILIGDGCYTGRLASNGVNISCHDDKLAAEISTELAPLGCRLHPLTIYGEYRVSDSSDGKRRKGEPTKGIRNPVRAWLVEQKMWGQSSGTKELPNTIWTWDNQSVARLIGGLIATDGCVHVTKLGRVAVSLGSNSLKLMTSVRELLLLRFGIITSMPCGNRKKKSENEFYAANYTIAVNGHDGIAALCRLIPIPGVKGPKLVKALAAWDRHPNSAEPGRCSLVSQEQIGIVNTFDIEVDHSDHLFVLANGLIVSNSEPISQGQLNAKHSGGVAGQEKAVGGFKYLDQLIQIPQKMVGGAAHATLDGTVQRVEEAAAGGQHVTIDGKSHYVGAGFTVRVKKGDVVEAGDMISDGIPNPSIITEHKGVGEGRRYFVNEFRTAMRNSNMGHNRRNIELLARGLINHVKLTEETDTNVPDDIVPYSTLEHTYKPRAGYEQLTPKKALGQYLERPVLHYTIGTKVRPSMLRDFDEFGVTELPVHKQAPPFVPHMVRGMYQLQHDPDWMTQMYGAGLKKSLLTSTARGATSEERGTSFVPSLAAGIGFGEGEDRAVIKPKAPYALPSSIMPGSQTKVADNDLMSNMLLSGALGSGLGATAGLGYAALTDKKYKQRLLQGGLAGGLLGGGLGYAATDAEKEKPTVPPTAAPSTVPPTAGRSQLPLDLTAEVFSEESAKGLAPKPVEEPLNSNLIPSPLQAPGRPRLTPLSDRATLEVKLNAIGQPQQLARDLPQDLSPPDADEVERRRQWREGAPEPTWPQYLFEGKRGPKDDVTEQSLGVSLAKYMFDRAQGRRQWEGDATEPSKAELVARGKTNFELEPSKERLVQVKNDLVRTKFEYDQHENWWQAKPNPTASELQAHEAHETKLQARYAALGEQKNQLEVDSQESESRNQGVFADIMTGLTIGGIPAEKLAPKLLKVPGLGRVARRLGALGGLGGPIAFVGNAVLDVPGLVDRIRTNGWDNISTSDAKQHMHDLTLQNGIMPAFQRVLAPVLDPVPTASMVANQVVQGGKAIGSLIRGGTNTVQENAAIDAEKMNLIHTTSLRDNIPELEAWKQRLDANPQDQQAASAVRELSADIRATQQEQELAAKGDVTKDWKYTQPEFKAKLEREVSLADSALQGARARQESPETIEQLENWHSQVSRLAALRTGASSGDFPRMLQLAVRGPQQRQIEIQRELAQSPTTEQAVALRQEYTNNVVKLQKMHNWAK